MRVNKHYLVIVLSAAAFFLVVMLIIVPSVRDIIELKSRITDEREKLDQLLASGKTMKKLIDDYERVKTGLPRLQSVFLATGNELAFIETLESMAKDTNLEIELSFDSNIAEDAKVTPIPAMIKLDGSFKNVLIFLDKLERQEFYTTLSSFRVTSHTITRPISGFSAPSQANGAASSDDGSIRAEIGVMTYWK